jgi:hypothetical protein
MSDKSEIIIAAKDQASKVLDQIAKNTEQLAKKTDELNSRFKLSISVAGAVTAAYGAIKAAMGFASAIDMVTDAYNKQAKAARGMTDQQKSHASAMQAVLGVGDEVTLQLMRQAQMLGMSASQSEQATQAAIGLAQATGMSLESALTKVNQVMNGNVDALAKTIPAMKGLTTEEEKLAAVNDLINRGLAEQADQMNSLEGVQTRASNSIGDLYEQFGALIAPIRMVISHGLAVFAETMQSVLAPAVEYAQGVLANMGPILEKVSQWIVGAITIAEVAWNNFPKIIQIMIAQAEIYLIGFVEGVKHTFTVALPAYFNWLYENGVNIVRDAFMAYVTIATNGMQMFQEIISKGIEWVTSGFKGGFDGLTRDLSKAASRNLLEGFKATTQPLPTVLERQLTDREKELKARVASMGASMGEEFANKFDERMGAISNTFSDFNNQVQIESKKSAESIETTKSLANSLQATESRLLTRGSGDDPSKQIARNTEQGNKLLVEANKTLSKVHESLTMRDRGPQLELVSG